MEIKFNCSRCGQRVSAEPADAGITLPCPACGVDLTIPTPAVPDLPPAKSSAAAIWSLVLGILSLLTCFIGPLLGIPAVIFGHVARSRIRRGAGRLTGGGMATAGLSMGYAAIGLFTAVVAAQILLITANLQKKPGSGTRAEKSGRGGLLAMLPHKASNVEIHYQAGRDALKRQDYGSAVASFDKALALLAAGKDQGDKAMESSLHVDRGLANVLRGDPNQAYTDYSNAIRADARNAVAYQNRGYLLLRDGRFMPALDDLNRAIKLDPGYAAAYVSRAQLHERQSQRAEALRDYRKALELAKTDEERNSEAAAAVARKIAELEGSAGSPRRAQDVFGKPIAMPTTF